MHNLYDESGREVTRPVVYLDAFHGWVRETVSMWGAHRTTVIATGENI